MWDKHAFTIDSSGNVFVAGKTVSDDYPIIEGAYDTTYNGGYSDFMIDPSDVIVSKLDGNLSTLLSSTFIGGSGNEYATAIAIDSSGDVFVAGVASAPDYPTTEDAYDTTYNDSSLVGTDIFISKLDNNLSEDPLYPVVPDIKANGSDGPLTIAHHDTVSITVALSPGSHDGEDVDWWILMETPSGWYHYNTTTKSWDSGIAVSHQGALREIDTRELWEGSIHRTGSYTFHFKIDTNMNGVMDEDLLYEDSVVVEVVKKKRAW